MHIRVKRPHFSSQNTGYVSWRDTQAGSWYIETLDRVLEENAALVDLVTMLMMVRCFYFCGPKKASAAQLINKRSIICAHLQVNEKVSQNQAKGLYKQMPGSFIFLRKLFFFNTQP